MDPQQELFSEFLVSLREKYKDTGIGVYDTRCYRQMIHRILSYILQIVSRMTRIQSLRPLGESVRHFMCGMTIQDREGRYQAF